MAHRRYHVNDTKDIKVYKFIDDPTIMAKELDLAVEFKKITKMRYLSRAKQNNTFVHKVEISFA